MCNCVKRDDLYLDAGPGAGAGAGARKSVGWSWKQAGRQRGRRIKPYEKIIKKESRFAITPASERAVRGRGQVEIVKSKANQSTQGRKQAGKSKGSR